jgi:hypothetical protein
VKLAGSFAEIIIFGLSVVAIPPTTTNPLTLELRRGKFWFKRAEKHLIFSGLFLISGEKLQLSSFVARTTSTAAAEHAHYSLCKTEWSRNPNRAITGLRGSCGDLRHGSGPSSLSVIF